MTIRRRLLSSAAIGVLTAVTAQADQPARKISLDEAVRLALAQNLTIRNRRIDPQIADLSIAQARGAWRPNLQTNVSDAVDQFNALAGASQLLPWGGRYSIGWSNTRVQPNGPFATIRRGVSSTLTGSYEQPLLRDFRIDAARGQLRQTTTAREVSDIELQQTTVATVRSVKVAYWALVYANSALAVQRQSLDLARESLRVSHSRLRAGMMAPVDVAEAESEVAQREESVIVAEVAIGRAEDRLRTLILDPASPDFWTVKLEPVDHSGAGAYPVDVDAAVENAMAIRTDLLAARKRVDVIDVDVQLARNQRLPDVRAAAGYGSSPNPFVVGSAPRWSLSLTVAHPIDMRAANAAVARTTLERARALGEIRSLELQVAADVRDAGRRVAANAKRIEATAAARVLAERRLDAEEKRFAAGMSTAFVVFQAQRDLTQARNAELRATLDYETSIVEFEAIQQTPKEDL